VYQALMTAHPRQTVLHLPALKAKMLLLPPQGACQSLPAQSRIVFERCASCHSLQHLPRTPLPQLSYRNGAALQSLHSCHPLM
jgi:hypothetical protein